MRKTNLVLLLCLFVFSLGNVSAATLPTSDSKSVRIELRLIARNISMPLTSFGLIYDDYLAEVTREDLSINLARVSYRFLSYESELPEVLRSSGKKFTVRAKQESSCEIRYNSFVTRADFDGQGNYLGMRSALTPLAASTIPKPSDDTLLPCFVLTREDIKKLRMRNR
jgi:hypothetical protein